MAKSLEEDLADYLLCLARGQWTKRYNAECLAMWRKIYGERIAARVEAIVRSKW